MKIHENMNSKAGVSGNEPYVTRQCELKAKFVGKPGTENLWNVPKGDTCRVRQYIVSMAERTKIAPTL